MITSFNAENITPLAIMIAGVNYQQQFVDYYEDINYIKNQYPIRMLTLNLSLKEIMSIRDTFALSDAQEDTEKVFPVRMTFKATTQDKSDLLPDPFEFSGEFLGSIINQDLPADFKSAFVNGETSDIDDPKNVQNRKNYRIVLYRRPEMNTYISPVNINTTGGELANLLFRGWVQSTNPNLKLVLSELDRNVTFGKMLFKPIDFPIFLQNLDQEFGLYKTPYSTFIENDKYYIINTSNNINCEYSDGIVSSLILNVNTSGGTPTYSIQDLQYIATIDKSFFNRVQNVQSVFKEKLSTDVYPDGRTKVRSGRGAPLYYKKTNIDRLELLNPVQREKIIVTLNGVSFKMINPLTKVTVIEDNSKPMSFRIGGIMRKIVGFKDIQTIITLFRNINEKDSNTTT